MPSTSLVSSAVLLLLLFPVTGVVAQGDAKPRTGLAVWDTGLPSKSDLPSAALAGKNDWTALPLDTAGTPFKGDAVLSNGRIALVLRQAEAAVEVHAVKPDGAIRRYRLLLQAATGEPALRLERMTLIENTRGSAGLEATFKTAKGSDITGRFRVKRGDIAVQVEPGAGAAKLRVECPGRYVVLPDFFADDMVFDAAKLPLGAVELPSENFLLHLTGGGDALAMCVFENRQQDVKVTLAGTGTDRQVTGSELGFEGKKIWVGLLEAPSASDKGKAGIWHVHDVKPADAGQKIPLDWQMPFLAQWRVDFAKPDGMTDSWEMLLQQTKGADYIKPSWLGSGDDTVPASRKRWNTVLGTFSYPCWSDSSQHSYVQPLKSKALRFAGPAVIYPIHRVKQTPLDAFTVVDVMRNTLGVGPCEHILDREGFQSEYRGRATCSVRDTLNPIYAGNEQKKLHAKVNKTLDEGLTFVKHIRGRITHYVAFGQKMHGYLAEQKKAHPDLAKFIDEMDELTQQIDRRVAKRVSKIQTPEYVAKMNEEFRKNVLDYDGPDAVKRCRDYTEALVVIGDNQDELSGECRYVVRALRQRAGILMALDPRVAPIAAEIRARTQEALRNPAIHESARH